MKAVIEDLNLLLTFEESLTSTTVQRLRQQYLLTLEEARSINSVVVDISHVVMIDSQGLNLIIGMFNDAQKGGRSFKLAGASPANKKLFDLVNLQDYVTLT